MEFKNLIVRRFAAFGIDYLVVATYALGLFGITNFLNLEEMEFTPINGQLLGFFTMTLPVFLYFYLTESGRKKATIGKRIMRISVGPKRGDTNPSIFLRNLLKFLPWEIGHTGVHWVVFYSRSVNDAPMWVWIALILPQIIMLVYAIGIIISRGEGGIYDHAANTVVRVTSNQQATD